MRRLAALLALLLALVSSAAWAQLPARPEGPDPVLLAAAYAELSEGAPAPSRAISL